MSLSTSLPTAVAGHRCLAGCCKTDPVTGSCVDASPACQSTQTDGDRQSRVIEFEPVASNTAVQRHSSVWPHPAAGASAPPTVRSSTAAATGPASAEESNPYQADPLDSVEACPFCGEEIKERPLFIGTFVGCLC